MIDYAQLTLSYSSIGMSLYELLNERLPRTSFDWNTSAVVTVSEQISQEKARQIATWIHDVIKQAQDCIKKAQDKKRRDVNLHRRPVDFEVKDKVFVLTKNWKTQRLSRKLNHQIAGPFEITRKIGNLYEVKLLNTIKIYNVFSPDRLRKAAEDPLLGQVNKPLSPIVITIEEEYKV
jgi:hypothetical protein